MLQWTGVSQVCFLSMWCHVFQGGVILVSHDERLIRLVCKELWVCEGGKVRRIDGGFDEYRDILHEQFKKEGYLWGPAPCRLTPTTNKINPAPLHYNTCHRNQSAVGADWRTFSCCELIGGFCSADEVTGGGVLTDMSLFKSLSVVTYRHFKPDWVLYRHGGFISFKGLDCQTNLIFTFK